MIKTSGREYYWDSKKPVEKLSDFHCPMTLLADLVYPNPYLCSLGKAIEGREESLKKHADLVMYYDKDCGASPPLSAELLIKAAEHLRKPYSWPGKK